MTKSLDQKAQKPLRRTVSLTKDVCELIDKYIEDKKADDYSEAIRDSVRHALGGKDTVKGAG